MNAEKGTQLCAQVDGKEPNHVNNVGDVKPATSNQTTTGQKTKQTGTSWLMAVFLLVNASLGAGMLDYPYAYGQAGGIYVATGIQVVVILALFSTMLILVYCSSFNNCDTYHAVLRSTCGKKAEYCAALSILVTCYGICVTFLMIIGDQYNRLFLSLYGPNFCQHWYLSKPFTIAVTATFLIAPTCFFKEIKFLVYLSAVGTFSMFYTVFLTVYEYCIVDAAKGHVKTVPTDFPALLKVTPVFAFAYQTHEIVLPVYASLTRRNIREFSKVSGLTMVCLFACYSTVGTFGYLTFGSSVQPDIMARYEAKDPLVLIALSTLVVKMVATYPQVLFCGRGAFDGLYAAVTKTSAENMVERERLRRVAMTVAWLVTTMAIAAFLPNINVSLSLLGSLAAVNTFIFPGLCLFRLRTKHPKWFHSPKTVCVVAASCLCIGTGGCMFIVIFLQVLADVTTGTEPESVSSLYRCL